MSRVPLSIGPKLSFFSHCFSGEFLAASGEVTDSLRRIAKIIFCISEISLSIEDTSCEHSSPGRGKAAAESQILPENHPSCEEIEGIPACHASPAPPQYWKAPRPPRASFGTASRTFLLSEIPGQYIHGFGQTHTSLPNLEIFIVPRLAHISRATISTGSMLTLATRHCSLATDSLYAFLYST